MPITVFLEIRSTFPTCSWSCRHPPWLPHSLIVMVAERFPVLPRQLFKVPAPRCLSTIPFLLFWKRNVLDMVHSYSAHEPCWIANTTSSTVGRIEVEVFAACSKIRLRYLAQKRVGVFPSPHLIPRPWCLVSYLLFWLMCIRYSPKSRACCCDFEFFMNSLFKTHDANLNHSRLDRHRSTGVSVSWSPAKNLSRSQSQEAVHSFPPPTTGHAPAEVLALSTSTNDWPKTKSQMILLKTWKHAALTG